MRFEIYSNRKKEIRIRFPIFMLTFALRFLPKFTFRYIPEKVDIIPNIKEIDFKILAEAFRCLRRYKGLKLVEIKSKDGTKIIIQI